MTAAVCRSVDRRVLARQRAAQARACLSECRLCAHDCGVNRLQGQLGLCRAGATGRIFSAQIEVGDELELIPTFAIALNGCDLRCAFCNTGEESWNARAGEPLDVDEVCEAAKRALRRDATTVMILGGEPTIHLPDALTIAASLPEDARLVWKTNAHASAAARDLLDGIFNVWLADYKFGNDRCAERLARIANYTTVVRENLVWAYGHSELIVRHLLMPGHIDCCWKPVAQWLAETLPGVKVSLRTGFFPAWQSARHPELRPTNPRADVERAEGIARDSGLNCIE
jgi:putative pyruvate formate lyase activating enzyme